MTAKGLAFVLTVVFMLSLLELIRKNKMTFKYAFGWFFLSLVALIFIIWDRWLFLVSEALGFELPSNFIFFTLLGGFVFLSLVLSIFLCQQNDRNDKLAQRLALLEFEVKTFKKKAESA